MNISKGGERGRGRVGRGVLRPNPQDFPPHNPQGVVYRPRGREEPVVDRGLGRGRGNLRLVEVWEGGMGVLWVTSGL